MNKLDVIIYGESDDLYGELLKWANGKGFTIKTDREWKVVNKPSYTGADGSAKTGEEDTYLIRENGKLIVEAEGV